jgi:hypothetical protein
MKTLGIGHSRLTGRERQQAVTSTKRVVPQICCQQTHRASATHEHDEAPANTRETPPRSAGAPICSIRCLPNDAHGRRP